MLMKLLSGLVNEVGAIIGNLTVSSTEKKQIEAELLSAICRQEEELSRSRADILRAEASGNWLQRSWRPLIMLAFALIVLVGSFFELPVLADTSRFWDLLEIGIGGYIIGRSAENVTLNWRGGRR